MFNSVTPLIFRAFAGSWGFELGLLQEVGGNITYPFSIIYVCLCLCVFSSIIVCSNKAKDAIFYSYTRHINGFAAMLEEEEAAEIASKHLLMNVSSYYVYYSLKFFFILS